MRGNGYILLYRFSRDSLRDFIPPALQDHFRGGFGVVMLVDYLSSEVGPYRELLLIPGRFAYQDGDAHTVTKIYVSTLSSALNGRANWGLPKALAEFAVFQEGDLERFRVSLGGCVLADLTLKASTLAIPFSTAVIPSTLRTLVQHHEGRTYRTTPAGRAKVKLGRLVRASIDEKYFPDIAKAKALLTVKVTDFTLCFPQAYPELPSDNLVLSAPKTFQQEPKACSPDDMGSDHQGDAARWTLS